MYYFLYACNALMRKCGTVSTIPGLTNQSSLSFNKSTSDISKNEYMQEKMVLCVMLSQNTPYHARSWLPSATVEPLRRFSIRIYMLITNTHAGKMSVNKIFKLKLNSITSANG